MRRFLRTVGELVVKLVLVLLLAAFLAVVWASNFPDAPIIEEAKAWPVIGPWVARGHRLYRPDPASSPDAAAEGPTSNADPSPRAPTPVVITPPHVATRATLVVGPGTSVRRQPDTRAEVVSSLDVYTNVKVLERRGDWHRIWRQADGGPVEGWVHQPDAPAGEPPLGREPEPPGPLMPRDPDPDRLAAARALLVEERQTSIGPYTFYTDHDHPLLERWLAALAAQLDAVYARRFGRQPIGTPRAAVVLFAEEERYAAFQARWQSLSGLRTTGHAVGSIVALWAGGQDLAAIASTLVHELVHLINRRALGPALPPWLDEGLAEALDTAQLDPDGTIDAVAIGGRTWTVGETITWLGGRASLRQVRQAIERGSLPSLRRLTGLDSNSFLRDPQQALYYAQSGFFVRYLLDADGGRHAVALHAFLDDIAAGQPPTGDALRARVGVEWPTLDAGFRAWIRSLDVE